MNIFIPQMPANIVNITTNSSSEIFVIGKHKMPELVDKIIDDGGWRWWFGERKEMKTLADVRAFVKENGHVVEHLLNLYAYPPSDNWSEKKWLYPKELAAIDREIEDAEKARPAYICLEDNNDNSKRDAEFKLNKPYYAYYRNIINPLWAKKNEIHDRLVEEWMDKQNLEKFIGTFYYECGEDNELRDWDEVHTSVPGKYARLS
jgi:hypothetical protein